MPNYQQSVKPGLIPRLPTQSEFDEFIQYEIDHLDPGGIDVGDLGYLIKYAAIAVFDHFGEGSYPTFYRGKIMVVTWGLRATSEYVWLEDGHIHVVNDENKVEVR